MKNLTLMIVEDEDKLREGLSKALSEFFLKIITAKNGDEGLKKFKKFNPDIIITDILMPIVDGLDMAKEIKKISKQTPIIVLSAYSEKDRLLRAIDAGIDKYLIKPIDVDELLRIIELFKDEKMQQNNITVINEHYKFDKIKRVLIKDDEEISLTKKELAFISLLLKQAGALILHEEIRKNIWTSETVSDTAIRTFIKRIKDKVGGDDLIKNVPGLGYKINL
ncbi:response regulator transcription factor [Campylobacter troglodytis]|uniref:response regulator transcription factor n=1 Tax=Campylobacter troglodytis TaxID=654363 RepID=UPI0011599112|nr:response regulator transcription factor [Campylobacter troglodytis]TQR60793.1 DNA-binding response regulator [Campylobacter troglodytis]